jgi:hypothetical protein
MHAAAVECSDFGSNSGELAFPTGEILDDITLHRTLVACARQLLRTNDVLLTQSEAWGKRGDSQGGSTSNQDQRMHMDYGNHTFLHPSHWDSPEVVAMIVYLSDTRETGGGTAGVPRSSSADTAYATPYVGMPGQKRYRWYNDRTAAETYMAGISDEMRDFRRALYEREVRTQPRAGDVLLYRHDVWHRGTPVRAGQVRNVVNLVWKNKACTWIGNCNRGWATGMYAGVVERVFERLTPDQRSVLGVPGVGDPYWNAERLAHLQARYPGIDIAPYASRL